MQLLELEKELGGTEGGAALARHDAVLAALEGRIAEAMRIGLPPTTAKGGTSFDTQQQAATTAPSPMVTPGIIDTSAPIQTFSPMVTSRTR